jgi:thiosulfate reductase cytochrome b subunit
MTPLDHFVGIFAISGCIWLILCIYISIRIERFIVKRYEQETDLLNTVCFREHATFTRYLPDFFSSALYNAHLLMCVWGWRLYKNRKPFRDIDNPEIVTQHFSAKEIRQAKWFLVSGTAFLLHCVAYLIFSFIWPDVFD